MSRKHQVHDTSDDAPDDVIYDGDVDAFMDAVNDSQYNRRSSRSDNLQARRRLESLLEERRLKQVIDDDWGLDGEEEEEQAHDQPTYAQRETDGNLHFSSGFRRFGQHGSGPKGGWG